MWFELSILFICLFLSAFFSATETAFISLSRIKLSEMVEKKFPAANLVHKLKSQPGKMLSTILIGNTIANIGASALATTLALSFIEGRGWGGIGMAAAIATGVMTFFLLVFGEIAPKTVAMKHAATIALISAWPIYLLAIIVSPIASVLTFFSWPLIYLFGGRMPEGGPFVTQEEIKFIIAASAREGIIEKDKKEMISSIFEFGETTVKEVMTPRPDIKAVEETASLSDVIRTVNETGHSRIPVYEGNIDNVIGMIYARDLMECRRDDRPKNYLRSVIFVPEKKRLDDLLHQMQAARTHIAIVVDEYGVTSGIVSLEDLIEEIVGEIHDEFERMEKNIDRIDENNFMVNGKAPIYDINRELGILLPEKDYDTVGGFVFGQLSKAPSVGDMVKYDGVQISVEKILKRRITRLKIVKLPRRIEDNMVGG
jgi:putative hemolysin